jgi:hypothetical protein
MRNRIAASRHSIYEYRSAALISGSTTMVAMDRPDLQTYDVDPLWPVGGRGEDAIQVTVTGGPWKVLRLERRRSHA